jgi:hypothetical protein
MKKGKVEKEKKTVEKNKWIWICICVRLFAHKSVNNAAEELLKVFIDWNQ